MPAENLDTEESSLLSTPPRSQSSSTDSQKSPLPATADRLKDIHDDMLNQAFSGGPEFEELKGLSSLEPSPFNGLFKSHIDSKPVDTATPYKNTNIENWRMQACSNTPVVEERQGQAGTYKHFPRFDQASAPIMSDNWRANSRTTTAVAAVAAATAEESSCSGGTLPPGLAQSRHSQSRSFLVDEAVRSGQLTASSYSGGIAAAAGGGGGDGGGGDGGCVPLSCKSLNPPPTPASTSMSIPATGTVYAGGGQGYQYHHHQYRHHQQQLPSAGNYPYTYFFPSPYPPSPSPALPTTSVTTPNTTTTGATGTNYNHHVIYNNHNQGQPAAANLITVTITLAPDTLGYCFVRPDGSRTRLVPVDMLPFALQGIPAREGGGHGSGNGDGNEDWRRLVPLPVPGGTGRDGTSWNVDLGRGRLRVDARTHEMHSNANNDPIQTTINKILSTTSSPTIQTQTQPQPPYSPRPPTQQQQQQQTRPKRLKVYCDKWVHDGVCAFTQQGCKFKHEMPRDTATQHQLGLFRGLPAWWKKRQAELAAPVLGAGSGGGGGGGGGTNNNQNGGSGGGDRGRREGGPGAGNGNRGGGGTGCGSGSGSAGGPGGEAEGMAEVRNGGGGSANGRRTLAGLSWRREAGSGTAEYGLEKERLGPFEGSARRELAGLRPSGQGGLGPAPAPGLPERGSGAWGTPSSPGRWPWDQSQHRPPVQSRARTPACTFAFHPSSSPFGPIGPPRQSDNTTNSTVNTGGMNISGCVNGSGHPASRPASAAQPSRNSPNPFAVLPENERSSSSEEEAR
ncbi:hypothetical protein VTK26DRAFT_9129 [Humicola hyalothermophila]